MIENDQELFRADASRRLFLLGGIQAILLTMISGRLFYLQVLQEGTFRSLAESNRVSLQPVPAPRGRIFDRFGTVLVENRPDFRLSAIPELAGNMSNLLEELGKLLSLTPQEVESVLKQAKAQRPFLPLTIKPHLTWEELARVQVQIHRLPGARIENQSLRFYPQDTTAAHILGYMGETSDTDKKLFPDINYRPGDLTGKAGVERRMEPTLRGVEGVKEMEVTAHGREVRELSTHPPAPGKDLFLTLDLDLQRVAEEALDQENKTGAVVVLDPRSGEVLVMASRPSYDPNRFIGGISSAVWKELTTDRKRPMINKAIQGQYPPGSTFKMVVALAGLSEGKITPHTQHFCPGFLSRYNHQYHCWKRGGHGTISLVQAIAQSCDVFFYKVAELLGIDLIEQYGRKLGLGDPTGIDLDGERPGLLPSKDWKEAAMGVPWYPGETYVNSIGQGYVLTTPLQLAMMISTLANGGILYRPTMVREIRGATPQGTRRVEPQVKGHGRLNPEALSWVRAGMEEVVNGPRGTARLYGPDGVRAAGKTGTAQVVRIRREASGKAMAALRPDQEDHALFVCYAPVDEPELAISVIVEHGGHGGSAAGPVAQRIMNRYFKRARDGVS